MPNFINNKPSQFALLRLEISLDKNLEEKSR